jgi:hypothetical protein
LAFLAQQHSCLYAYDQEGHRNYKRDIRAWESVYGATTPMSFNCEHLPLHPGGTALGSQECYGCGRTGHMASSMTCQLNEEERNTPRRLRERAWRSYINKILHSAGSRTPIHHMGLVQSPGISLLYAGEDVMYDPCIYDIDSIMFVDEGQGNGGEPRE